MEIMFDMKGDKNGTKVRKSFKKFCWETSS